jgi:proton-coupled amino acid transporter
MSSPLRIHRPNARRGDETIFQVASSAAPSIRAGTTPAVGTPDFRALRAAYTGTPPVPNIPPRVAAAVTGGATTPLYKPASSASLASTPQRSGQAFGGISATRQQLPQLAAPISDLDDLPIEDKVQVLQRHLVAPELRTKPGSPAPNSESSDDIGGKGSESTQGSIRSHPTGVSGDAAEDNSRRSSIIPPPIPQPQKEGSEAFPIPFHAPGADVT